MKKFFVIISLIIVLTVLLVGCYGQKIEFTSEFKPIDNIDGSIFNIQFGNLFYSRDSLVEFYQEDIFKDVDKESELQKYDDEYFNSKALLIVMFWDDKNSIKSIKSVSVKGNELWVNVQSTSIKEFNELSRFFIELDKETVKNISVVNYKILTVV